jgi:hypothetical protein
MADWILHRPVDSNSNEYVRFTDPVGGSAVLYGHADERLFEVYINGQHYDVPWPDTSAAYDGDSGRPVGWALRYEGGGWWLYSYEYSGDRNRSEWKRHIV